MRRQVIDCDRCGAENIGPDTTLSLCVDRKADGAGGMEDIYVDFDLCLECFKKTFKRDLHHRAMTHEDAAWLAEEIRKSIHKRAFP